MAAQAAGIKAPPSGPSRPGPASLPAMPEVHPPLPLPDPEATAALGRALATRVGAGDVVLLEGGLGAGKTHLARALIRALLARDEDVPSPSFTLVQIYETPDFEIWHADLYRLTAGAEIPELGLDDAAAALCLIEWPDRLAAPPAQALTIRLSPQGEGRSARFLADDPAWESRLSGLADVC